MDSSAPTKKSGVGKNMVKKKKQEKLQRLRSEISELENQVDKNYYWEMLKVWLLVIVTTGAIFGGSLVYIIYGPIPEVPPSARADPAKVEELAKSVFTATVTVNGIVMGFVPVVSFFFVRELREQDNEQMRQWERVENESKGEELKLNRYFYNLLLVTLNNIWSGVLKYTRTYIVISVLLQFFLITFYVGAILLGATGLFIFADVVFLEIIFGGIVPLISFAFHRPTFRLVRYAVVEKKGEIIRIEPED